MSRLIVTICVLFTVVLGSGMAFLDRTEAAPTQTPKVQQVAPVSRVLYPRFQVDVVVNGRPLTEYHARGRTYVEALRGAEYELRIRNSSADRVAVALSVDGLNTIDARHTSAWNASKWVIEPHQTITVGGWQMSSERARRFYFTNESDSYGAKLGQTSNLGVISAVFFKERRRVVPITPPYPIYREEGDRRSSGPTPPSSKSQSAEATRDKSGNVMPRPDDDYAATGIGRSVRNDVRWVNLDLDSQPVAAVNLRYEFYETLLRLGVLPRPAREPFPIQRREDSRGFSPEP